MKKALSLTSGDPNLASQIVSQLDVEKDVVKYAAGGKAMKFVRRSVLLVIAGVVLGAGSARAQLSGSGIGGDFGMKSGSQPPPGFYLGYMLYYYDTSRLAAGTAVQAADPLSA